MKLPAVVKGKGKMKVVMCVSVCVCERERKREKFMLTIRYAANQLDRWIDRQTFRQADS